VQVGRSSREHSLLGCARGEIGHITFHSTFHTDTALRLNWSRNPGGVYSPVRLLSIGGQGFFRSGTTMQLLPEVRLRVRLERALTENG
jgi:hypothetical protein